MFAHIEKNVTKIKLRRPLVLNITNVVTMDFVANGLLSLGASPVMSKASAEIEDLVLLSNSVVINLGTLDEAFLQLCAQVCYLANQLQKPIILDPVGAGASRYRTAACLELIKSYHIAVIRGNASEIRALAEEPVTTKGVESVDQSENAIHCAQMLSRTYQAAIVISGATDVVIEEDKVNRFQRGSPLMPMITGTGCLLSAVVAAFHAVDPNRFTAAMTATVFYSLCGEIAARVARGPGSFKTAFLDALHEMPDEVQYAKS
jgi:hydroxyethylthiazole kinase